MYFRDAKLDIFLFWLYREREEGVPLSKLCPVWLQGWAIYATVRS